MNRILKINTKTTTFDIACKMATVETFISPIDNQIRKIIDINLLPDYDEMNIMSKCSKIMSSESITNCKMDNYLLFDGSKYTHKVSSAKLFDKNGYTALIIELIIEG